MSYTPPIGNNIVFSLSASYTPPIGNNIIFDFSEAIADVNFIFNPDEYITPVNNNIIFWFNQPNITSIPFNIINISSSLDIQYSAALNSILNINSVLNFACDIIITIPINSLNILNQLDYDSNSQVIVIIPSNNILTENSIYFGQDKIINIPSNDLIVGSVLNGLYDHYINFNANILSANHSLSGVIELNQLQNNITINSNLSIQTDIIDDFKYLADIGQIYSEFINLYTLQDKFFIDFIYKNGLYIKSDFNFKLGINTNSDIICQLDISANLFNDNIYSNSLLFVYSDCINNNHIYVSTLSNNIISNYVYTTNAFDILIKDNQYLYTYYINNDNQYKLDLKINIYNNNIYSLSSFSTITKDNIYYNTFYILNANEYRLDLRSNIINNNINIILLSNIINSNYEYKQGFNLYSNVLYNSNIAMDTTNDFIYDYNLTQIIDNIFSDLYDLHNNNILFSNNNISYYVASDRVETYQNTLEAYINEEYIELVSCSFSIDENSYSYLFSAEVATIDDWLKCVTDKEITVYVNTNRYIFIIDNRARNRVFESDVYTIEARSYSAKLEKTDEVISMRYDNILASHIIQDIENKYEVNIINTMLDWFIPEDILVFDKSSPIAILERLVESGGGLIYADNLGNLKITQKYSNSTSYNESFNDYDSIYSISESKNILPSWTAVIISNVEDGDYAYNISEIEVIDTYTKKIRVKVYPFLEIIDLLTSYEDSSIIIKGLNNPIEEIIKDEIVEIIEGQGSTSESIKQIVKYEYLNNILGNLQFSNNTIKTSNKGQSLLKITYKTEYHDFILYNGIHTDNIQVYTTDENEVI